jgi:hypothetical protein
MPEQAGMALGESGRFRLAKLALFRCQCGPIACVIFSNGDLEAYLPNIFAMKKMTTAPKRPPPPRIYIKE